MSDATKPSGSPLDVEVRPCATERDSWACKNMREVEGDTSMTTWRNKMTEFEEQQQYAAALAARNDEFTRLDAWRDRALKAEQLLRQINANRVQQRGPEGNLEEYDASKALEELHQEVARPRTKPT